MAQTHTAWIKVRVIHANSIQIDLLVQTLIVLSRKEMQSVDATLHQSAVFQPETSPTLPFLPPSIG